MHAACRETEERVRMERRSDSLPHFKFLALLILSQGSSHCQALFSAFHPLPGGFGDEVWH